MAPDGEGGRRTFFVSRTCDGHLIMGAMWADLDPWRMRSMDDTSFEWPGSSFSDPVHARFAAESGDRATGVTIDLDGFTDPMIRLGDLPEGWQPDCGAGG